jgi:hypothetical protein
VFGDSNVFLSIAAPPTPYQWWRRVPFWVFGYVEHDAVSALASVTQPQDSSQECRGSKEKRTSQFVHARNLGSSASSLRVCHGQLAGFPTSIFDVFHSSVRHKT